MLIKLHKKKIALINIDTDKTLKSNLQIFKANVFKKINYVLNNILKELKENDSEKSDPIF